MKKTVFAKAALATLALSMMVTAPLATFNVSANDGKGIYAEKETTTIKEMNRDAVVTASSANVREGISTSYRVLNVFGKGTKFHIDGVAVKGGEQTDWYRVIVKDQQYGGECSGYIHKSTFQFTDEQDEVNEDLRSLFDSIYAAQPGTAGGSEKTMEAATKFQEFIDDQGDDLTADEISYATELYLNEKAANDDAYVENFKDSFDAVCTACTDEDEDLEYDVNYSKFVNGINDAITNVMDNNDADDEDQNDNQEDQNNAKCDFTVKKESKTIKAAHDVYVRKGPKTSYDKIGSYAKGADVKVTGQVYKHGNKACWVQVDYKGKTGYVCTDYLK